MNGLVRQLIFIAVAVLGAFALGVVALRRDEAINALWIVVAALSLYTIAYRYYSLFLARKVVGLDRWRVTPAVANDDGLDYVPTHRHVLFGHHFAAIAGAGPLVGPVLAAQLGYLPGVLWLIVGVVFAGAVQDFLVLFISTRRNGRSIGELVRMEMGDTAGVITLFGTFMIMIIILSVLALIVVKALAHSAWGLFTVAATIPIAVLMGLYLRYLRPGRVGEVSIAGFVLLMLSIWGGGLVSQSPTLAPMFTFEATQIAWMLIGYGFVAAVLPVWLLLAPRDYLSTFLKIGTIALLAIAILFVAPQLKMPALTQFVDGSGPVWKGSLFPFLFITIACGAISGFHALICSGTTPKLIASETDIRYIGYGAMLAESFVGIMALVAASVIEPGVYFAMNSPAAVVGSDVASVAQAVSSWGFTITPEQLETTAKDIGETTVLGRAGGAPTLAVGMAQILHGFVPAFSNMGFWYHFAILFEALFILTAVDAGTRAGRFMLQDLLGRFVPMFRDTSSLPANLVATAGCVACWGWFLYAGVTDPFGGINTLWPMFGISNQMLAGIALMLATVVLIRMKRERYALVPALPALWLLVCTGSAGLIKLFSRDPAIGFIAQARRYQAAIAEGSVLAPAKTAEQMQQIVFNGYINAALTALFLAVMLSVLVYSLRVARQALKLPQRSDHEVLQAVGQAARSAS
ncbi:carbon starvation CstA family protein [Hydrocarboniphaga effusa]|uniref:carbon starvation CstA family protein n=1 Tax=Hydrocarboniphaga effusa TaxID=243629 RepID=UPI00398BEB39